MTIASNHTQACFDAWIHCENLLQNITTAQTQLSRKFAKVVDECALICMGTFHAMKSKSQNISRMAMLCVGICEECAELCESLNDDQFRKCAATCRNCSETMSQIAFSNLN